MKKFVEGLLFDTEESDGWIIRETRTTGQRITLWRTPDGQWVNERREGGLTLLSRINPATAATSFSERGIDLPEVLVEDLQA